MREEPCPWHTAITSAAIVKNSSPAALASPQLHITGRLTVDASGPEESTSATPAHRPAVSAEAKARRIRLQGSSSPRSGGDHSGSKPPLPYTRTIVPLGLLGGVDSYLNIKKKTKRVTALSRSKFPGR
jgi:hypothetical protein